MAKLADFITQNYPTVEKLTKVGVLSTTLKCQYDIYQHFTTTKHIKSTMQRYENTAEAMKVSTPTVRKAIQKMKKNI